MFLARDLKGNVLSFPLGATDNEVAIGIMSRCDYDATVNFWQLTVDQHNELRSSEFVGLIVQVGTVARIVRAFAAHKHVDMGQYVEWVEHRFVV